MKRFSRSGLVLNRANSSFEHLTINLKPSKKLVRKDSMEGRDFTVVPMVMMKEGVLNGSAGPLFYPSEEISKLPVIWNGKPVVVYHPQINGNGVSACSPEIFTAQKIGVIMNTKYDEKEKRLTAEAWIEENRCKKVDKRVWNAIEKEQAMELSTGLFTDNEPVENGKFGDREYTFVARNYKPDHLAVLPDQVGACSLKDGAGFVRNELFAENLTSNRFAFDDVRQQLQAAIKEKHCTKDDKGREFYCWVETVYDDYVVFQKDGGKTMGQSYTIDAKGKVMLTGIPVLVRRKTVYVDEMGKTVVGNVKPDYSRKEKVAILLANGAYFPTDRTWLMGLERDKLNKIFLNADKKNFVRSDKHQQ